MKKIKTLLCFLCVILFITGCSEPEPENNGPKLAACYKYDKNTHSFSDEVLIYLALPAEYYITEQAKLSVKEEGYYYIGSFSNNNITVNIIQDEKLKYDEKKYSAVCETWNVPKKDIEVIQKSFSFYRPTNDDYTLCLTITNKNEMIDLETALRILQQITTEECYLPEATQSLVAPASVQQPAKLNEWVTGFIKNPTSGKLEPIGIQITNIYSKEDSAHILQDYCNLHGIRGLDRLDAGLSYFVFDYTLFFSDFYTEGENGIEFFDLPFTLTNYTDTSTTIDGFIDIFDSIIDISENTENVHANTFWTSGRAYFVMSTNYTKFLIKLQEKDQEAKYFSLY